MHIKMVAAAAILGVGALGLSACTPTLNATVSRYQANMVYDSKRHRTVLFGGLRYDGTYGFRFSPETWEWDGMDWTQIKIGRAHV